MRRDARPFLSHHLRQRANARTRSNGEDLHVLARWVENLLARDPRMARIEATDALDYRDGTFRAGPEAEALINTFADSESLGAREAWLDRFADAVMRHWA